MLNDLLLMTQLPRDRVWMWLDSLVLNLVFFLLNMLSSWHLHFFHINHNNDNNYNDKMEVQRSERICPRTQLELRFGCGNHSVSLLAGLVFPLSSSSHFFFIINTSLSTHPACLLTPACLLAVNITPKSSTSSSCCHHSPGIAFSDDFLDNKSSGMHM